MSDHRGPTVWGSEQAGWCSDGSWRQAVRFLHSSAFFVWFILIIRFISDNFGQLCCSIREFPIEIVCNFLVTIGPFWTIFVPKPVLRGSSAKIQPTEFDWFRRFIKAKKKHCCIGPFLSLANWLRPSQVTEAAKCNPANRHPVLSVNLASENQGAVCLDMYLDLLF